MTEETVKHGLGPNAKIICGDGFQDVAVLVGPLLIFQQGETTICLPGERSAELARIVGLHATAEMRAALEECVAVLKDPVVGTCDHDDPAWYQALDKAVEKAIPFLTRTAGER